MRAWLQLVRAPAVFTALSNILAAHLIVTGGAVLGPTLALLCVASVCLYGAGMILNDCFDYAEDLAERPNRPLPSGRVSRRAAWLAGSALLVAGIAVAAAASMRSATIAAILAVAIVLYDGVLKGGPAAPVAMAACRALNWLLGLSAVAFTTADAWLALPVFFYVAGLTTLSTVETTAASRAPVAVCAAGLVLAFAAMAALVVTGTLDQAWALLPAAAATVWILARLGALWRDFSPGAIQGTVGFLIMGIVPLDTLMTLAGGPWWGAAAVLVLMLPGRYVARRIYVT